MEENHVHPEVEDQPEEEPSRAVVVRARPAQTGRWSDRVATAVRRLSEQARNPAVAATAAAAATVAGDIAVRAVRQALVASSAGPTRLHVTALVVHRIEVVHHYAPMPTHRALPPG